MHCFRWNFMIRLLHYSIFLLFGRSRDLRSLQQAQNTTKMQPVLYSDYSYEDLQEWADCQQLRSKLAGAHDWSLQERRLTGKRHLQPWNGKWYGNYRKHYAVIIILSRLLEVIIFEKKIFGKCFNIDLGQICIRSASSSEMEWKYRKYFGTWIRYSCVVFYKHTRDDFVIAEIYRVNKQYQVKQIKLVRLQNWWLK